MSTTKIPTLDELLERIEKFSRDPEMAKYSESFEAYFRLVATGQYPVIEDSNAMFAAQCVLVLVEHVRQTKLENKNTPPAGVAVTTQMGGNGSTPGFTQAGSNPARWF